MINKIVVFDGQREASFRRPIEIAISILFLTQHTTYI